MLDAYTRVARITPGLIAAAPALCVAGVGGLTDDPGIRALAVLSAALAVVLAVVVRSAGRRLESALWASWGGSPTVRRLRWRGAGQTDTVERLHARMNELLSERLPDRDEEASDPERADRRYEEAIAVLRERTRDEARFRLVAKENADYGFRRNSLGIRLVALWIAAIATGTSLVAAFVRGDEWGRWGIATIVGVAALFYWSRIVTPNWVREAAELYSDRLLEAVDTLRRDSASS